MSQQNKNTNQNNENLDEDRIPFDEEEPDAAELYGTIRTIYDENGRELEQSVIFNKRLDIDDCHPWMTVIYI